MRGDVPLNKTVTVLDTIQKFDLQHLPAKGTPEFLRELYRRERIVYLLKDAKLVGVKMTFEEAEAHIDEEMSYE